MQESLKNKTVKGTMWSAVERFSVQGVSFVVMVIMARILTPDDYGIIGMLTVFIAISQSLIDSGFSQALIRKQNRTQIDCSTVFYFNIVVGVLLYTILYFCAPLIARFYDEPLLESITRFISLSIVINSFVVVQRALLTNQLDFKTQAKASLSAVVISGLAGIWMAKSGYGVWSIVAYQLVNIGVNAGLLWVFSRWRPSMQYSWSSFREMFGFGSKLAASGIIDTVYKNIYLIVIGKVFKAADLGYYTRAHQFADLPSSNLTGIIQRVTFPVLCSIQDDDDRLGNVYRRFLKLSAFVMFPLMMGLVALSHPLVVLLLKEQWSFAAVLLQILCFSMMWYPIHSINLNLLQVKGRSDLFLKLEIYKKLIGVLILCITIPMGLIAMCVGSVVSSVLSLAINTYYTRQLIGLGFFKQMKDLLPSIGYSVSMLIVVHCVSLLFVDNLYKVVVGVAVGILYYIFISKITHSAELADLLSLIHLKLNK